MALILVVEDDAASQELVAKFLRRSGHRVLLADDGSTAVESARQNIPDLVLMDLNLPGMDGWEASGLIRSNKETAHVPIIALTAHRLSGDISKALGAGIDDYETKPLVYQRLMKKISTLVGQP